MECFQRNGRARNFDAAQNMELAQEEDLC